MRISVSAALLAALCVTSATPLPAQNAPRAAMNAIPNPDLLAANKAYEQKSYARALELYRAVKKSGALYPLDEVNFRIVTALWKTEKWDEAIESANFALKDAQNKAQLHYLLAKIYVQAPKTAWKIGEKTLRQDEYPEVPDGAAPQRIDLRQSDEKAVIENFEAAKTLAQTARGTQSGLPRDEEIDLNFDLAAYLPQSVFEEFLKSLEGRTDGKFDDAIDLREKYARGWSLPKRVLYLYHEIRALDESKTKTEFAKSQLAQGLFLRAYESRMEAWAPKYDEAKKQNVTRPSPFQGAKASAIWRQLADRNHPEWSPRALLFLAEERDEQTEAIKDLRELLRRFPKSKLVSDARAQIAQIEEQELRIMLTEATRPGKNPKLNVTTRNLGEVRFTAYKVKLENFLTLEGRLQNPEVDFTNFEENFGKIGDAVKKFGAPVASWNLKTKDKGDYETVYDDSSAPFSQIGAYAVIARAGKRSWAQIVVISDLALLKKADRNGTFVYVANAQTGQAENGANVVLKEVWNWNPRRVSIARGKTDDGGFFEKKRVGDNNNSVAAFAHIGDRYALTGGASGYFYGYGYRQNIENRALGYTDRPVYRPNQKVNFRFVVTSRGPETQGGDWKPLAGREFGVTAYNPKGEKVWDGKFKTNEFGSLSGDFSLPQDAALGAFSVQISEGTNFFGSAQFRVEEYKRPEFEVTVSAPQEAKRPGETVAARINAKYYFGAPVPNATVKYTVRKSSWWASYNFPSRWDWLFNSWGVNRDRRNIGGEGTGEIVKEGEVKTDEKGFAEVTFQTRALEPIDENNWWARYQNPLYTIEAEVTDASRRTIEAQGVVRVSRQPYFVFLNTERGYFQKGDRVPVEVRAQDSNSQGVAASGTMRVFKMLPENREEKVFESAVSTDATGKAFWNWEASDGGQFRVEFDGMGEWGERVKASAEVWVVDEKMSAIRLRGVSILLDKRDYAQGDVLRAAIVADKPGAQVLLTQEASGQILRRDVIEVGNQSRIIEIPIEKKHVPNFFLAAALIQDYEVFQAQTEVFVPPVRQILDLKVKGDKPSYAPGEKGVFEIEARDYSGAPARAEVSLALIDASLLYIASDQTPDVRQYFYGERRANSVNLDSSRSGNPQARAEGPDLPRFETHPFQLPDEMGQLQLEPGNFGYWFGNRRIGRARMNRSFALEARSENFAYAADVGELLEGLKPVQAIPAAPMSKAMADDRVVAGTNLENAPQNAPAPRTNFAETAFWSPSVITENGRARVEVTFPDSLTQWNATARGLTQTVQVASAQTEAVTKKDLLVRLQAPRFFVERDEVVISANVHNYSAKPLTANVQINAPFAPIQTTNWPAQSVSLAPNSEKRFDWRFKIENAGTAKIRVSATAGALSDAVETQFPVLVHGAPVFAAQSGKIERDGTTKIALNFPKERELGASQLNVQLNPSLAATMLDALPYLADYPYGCVEQTTSRFVPTILVEKTLRDNGINLETLRARAKAYEAESKSQNVGERVKNTGYTFPKGQPNARDLEKMASNFWFANNRGKNPIFDAQKVREMSAQGLQRIASMQRGDGGWGWFAGAPQSDPYMSAYVVYALTIAKNAGANVNDGVLNRGRAFLNSQMRDEDSLQLLTYMAYALGDAMNADAKKIAAGRLFEQRERLPNISKAYLALALHGVKEVEKAKILVANLENTLSVDAQNGTARWKTGAQSWLWWNNDVETVALGLRAFLTVEPQNKFAPMLVKWLTLQARGNAWRSTKETAEVVYTLAQWVQIHRELDVDMTIKVSLNDKVARTYRVTRDNALFFDNRFIAGDLFLENGANTLQIEKTGRGNVYFSAYSEYFSREELIKGSGNELKVTRRFFKLTRKAAPKTETADEKPVVGAATNARIARPILPPRPFPVPSATPEYDRTEILDGAQLKSGDLVEVELVLDAKNDYQYLIFEDMKAAGMEAVDVRSGYDSSDSLSYYVELRDEKAAFFVTNLPQGRRVLRYRLRAEIPGRFHALPTNGYAMYAPEVRGTSDEIRVGIVD